ncbi:MAG: LysM peptidoglycan-binding domain-containing protein [Prevotella sp.]|jgi:LysM repeat protein|nr:LysM peptidoglycan-binding domain-containing protein [Prevotella sp.]
MNLKKVFLLTIVLTASFAGIFFTNAATWHTAPFPMASACDDIIIHTVAKGETAYSIAAMYNTTVQQIYAMNPGAEKRIKAGDKLRIPKGKAISGYSNHLIEAKETLYSVARMYNISVDDIKDANQGLNESSFKTGKTIKIPAFGAAANAPATTSASTYNVQKGETLYSIGKKHNVSVEALLASNPSVKDSGLKEGTTLNIPVKTSLPAYDNRRPVKPEAATESVSKGETVRIGIFFSFTDTGSSIQKDKLAEYYEGFLLALRDLKAKGLNAEVYTFDTGPEKSTKRLESLFGTNEVKSLNLMIGGVSGQQIEAMSKFSKKTGIRYVIPFGSTNSIESDPGLFQMTTSHSNLYPEIIPAFVKKFSGYNIIFISETGSNDKADFVAELKKGLSKSNFQFKTITGSENLLENININLSPGKNILVPASSSEAALRKVLATMELLSASSVSLFGYPEWQAYTQHTEALHKFDSYIYSIFFLDEEQKEVQDVASQYKSWYGKNMINSFPKWGYLGYDAGLFFLTALKQYGSEFESDLTKIKVQTLQSAINFKHTNGKGGGYINNGLYFVHYKTNSSIEKVDISK